MSDIINTLPINEYHNPTNDELVILEKLQIFPEELIKRNSIAKYYTNNLPNQFRAPIISNRFGISKKIIKVKIIPNIGKRE